MTGSARVLAASRNYRDAAVIATGIVAVVLHAIGANWFFLALAAATTGIWVVAERRRPAYSAWVIQVAFVLLGTLMVWRFSERLLWLSVAGVWLLVVAADLSRMCERFPSQAGVLVQRRLVYRRLGGLAGLGVASAAVVALSLYVALELRLVAIALLALFLVMVAGRTIRSLGAGATTGNDDEPGR
jgi:hypothetical protein